MTAAASLILAHVGGAPVEELLLTVAPILSLGGWAYMRAWPERRRMARRLRAEAADHGDR